MIKALMCSFLLYGTLYANAQKATIAGELQSGYPTMENLSIEWTIKGDDNRNGNVTIRYREEGTGLWKRAMDLRRVPADSNKTSTNLGRNPAGYWGFRWSNKHAGSIFSLKPGTCYEIAATLTDKDGGSTTKAIKACTRELPVARKGDSVIVIPPGKYDTLLAAGGTESSRIIYRCKEGSAQFQHVDMRDKKYVWIDGLTIINDDNTGTGVDLRGCENCVVQNCDIKAVYGITAYLPGAVNCYIGNNTVTGPYPWGEEYYGANAETSGEGIQLTGPGNVVCYNTVSGYRDCISLMEDEHAANQQSIDIYNNDIYNGLDDGIEADFCFTNCRIYNNRMTNCFVGLSSQPSLGGPTYFIRNVMYNIIHSGFKLKRRSRGDVVLHNTLVKVGVGFGGNDTMDNAYFRNNLAFGGPSDYKTGYYGTGGPYAADMKDPGKHSDFDYDAVGAYGTPYKAIIGSKSFGDVEPHGIADIKFESVFSNVEFPLDFRKEFSPPDLQLKKECVAVDAGQVIANVNDDFTGKRPDIGAYEYGKPVPRYGAQRNTDKSIPINP